MSGEPIRRAKPLTNGDDTLAGYVVLCPGCGCGHLFHTVPWAGNLAGKPGPVWTFNGDLERPTFAGSMLVNASRPESRCHSHVRDGRIQFLSDCYHDLAGQTVDLPDIAEW